MNWVKTKTTLTGIAGRNLVFVIYLPDEAVEEGWHLRCDSLSYHQPLYTGDILVAQRMSLQYMRALLSMTLEHLSTSMDDISDAFADLSQARV